MPKQDYIVMMHATVILRNSSCKMHCNNVL